MTNDELFDDLKDFISTTMGQTELRLRSEISEEIEREVGGLRQEMKLAIADVQQEVTELRSEVRDGFRTIGEGLDGIHDTLQDHEHRITRLENRTA